MNYDDILKFIALFFIYNTGLFVGFILINDRYSYALAVKNIEVNFVFFARFYLICHK